MRYNEYIIQKPFDLPQLLLPSINFLRTRIGLSELGESTFFECKFDRIRPNKEAPIITTQEMAGESRYIRQMYQIGLIEVLRKTNIPGGLRMMKKAMGKLDNQCIRAQSPNLWWVAQGLLDAFISKDLTLSQTRYKLFSRLDRQIREIENKSNSPISDNKVEIEQLTREIIYLTWVSGAETPTINAILKHFNIEKCEFNEATLKSEIQSFRGPSDQDYESLSKALSEEVSSIELSINQYFSNADESSNIGILMDKMITLRNLLSLLKIDDQIVRLNVAIDIVKKAQDDNEPLDEKNENILMIIIESLKSAVDKYELAKYSGSKTARREKLSESQLKINEKTYQLVSSLIAQFTEFSYNRKKQLLLSGIDKKLAEIKNGFEQLNVMDMLPIIDGCESFFVNILMKNPRTTSDKALELFADIIGSLEFYLETLKNTSKPSPRIIEFAENSLSELNQITENSIQWQES
jgi:hypothetical protein